MPGSQYTLNFFFQAEDGIRDYKVTGVQTCALPIFRGPAVLLAQVRLPGAVLPPPQGRPLRLRGGLGRDRAGGRSEERRVGKECRSGGATDDTKKTEASSEKGGNHIKHILG